MDTFKLNNGISVIAKSYKGRLHPITYTNYTQAKRKAESIGGEVIQPRLGPCFYIAPRQGIPADLAEALAMADAVNIK